MKDRHVIDLGMCGCGWQHAIDKGRPNAKVLLRQTCRAHAHESMENEETPWPGEEWAGPLASIRWGLR